MRGSLVLGASLAFGVACSNGGSCPSTLPSCPDAAQPSWSADVAPIVQAQCASCHSPSGVEPAQPLVTYDDVFSRRGSVLDQVYGCLMPQGATMTPKDRDTLLTWLECGAPNN